MLCHVMQSLLSLVLDEKRRRLVERKSREECNGQERDVERREKKEVRSREEKRLVCCLV